MRLENIKISDIVFGDRRREELGDIQELANDIRENGLICPIAIVGIKPPYKLAAGGRRLAAVEMLKWDNIPCNIYDHDLSDLEIKSIELAENIKRKDLTYVEEVGLVREIHQLQQQIHGEGTKASGGEGHFPKDTAVLLGRKSTSHIKDDIRLAKAIEQLPDLGWSKCKTKNEAMKMLNRIEETLVRKEIAKRVESSLGPKSKRVVDAYYVGDFFEHVVRLPSGAFDLVEIDPPYGIDLPNKKLHQGDGKTEGKQFEILYGDSYHEVDAEQYPFFIAGVLKDLYRVMAENSWLIMWFGINPWFELIYREIIAAGFKARRIPCIWAKPGGQTLSQDIHLASAYETFFYAMKGSPTLHKQGRANVFNYKPVPPNQKIHPTEKPVDLIIDILDTFAWEGARIYNPFCGSGNTLKAAFELKMHPIGCEISEEYKDGYVTRVVERLQEQSN